MQGITGPVRKFSRYAPKGSKRSAELSNKNENVFVTRKGEQVSVLTPSGRLAVNKWELKNGESYFTGKPLTDYQLGKRAGYNQALGEQASIYKRKNSGK